MPRSSNDRAFNHPAKTNRFNYSLLLNDLPEKQILVAHVDINVVIPNSARWQYLKPTVLCLQRSAAQAQCKINILCVENDNKTRTYLEIESVSDMLYN